MNVWVRTTMIVAGVAVLTSVPFAAPPSEAGLAGIKLYDTGVDVVKRFGSPNEVLAVNIGGGGGGGGGFGGGGGGGAGGGGGGGGAGGGRAVTPLEFVAPPLSIRQMGLAPEGAPQAGGGPSAGGGAGGGGGAAGQMPEGSFFVRWVYQRGGGTSINFVFNKFNKVVQIEAMGLAASNVRTTGGIRLGSTIQQVMAKYETPDSYDVGGDYFMMKFLQMSRVAFRFTRETPKMPFRVTGIVVSAGKAE